MSTKKQRATGTLIERIRSMRKPSPRQVAIIAGLLILIALIGTRVIGLIGELREVRAARIELEGKRLILEQRHSDLEKQTQFVADPDNLEQELRSRFNYKKPGENVIIVVPPKETSSTNE